MTNANDIVGSHDLLFVTLDTLRFDVAAECFATGRIPNLSRLLPDAGWEMRHTPGSFTYSAHHAFFAGFLPTPSEPGNHPRLFACRFEGSETTTPETYVYDEATWIESLGRAGYVTFCIGGVGFFNRRSALSRMLPDLFEQSYWGPEMSVTSRHSTERQIELACRLIQGVPSSRRLVLFINISAIHQPNCIFAEDAATDSPATQASALEYVDACVPPLFDALGSRGRTFVIMCSDHGTAYGEDGFRGHRLSHPVVWTVPYAEFVIPQANRFSS